MRQACYPHYRWRNRNAAATQGHALWDGAEPRPSDVRPPRPNHTTSTFKQYAPPKTEQAKKTTVSQVLKTSWEWLLCKTCQPQANLVEFCRDERPEQPRCHHHQRPYIHSVTDSSTQSGNVEPYFISKYTCWKVIFSLWSLMGNA